MRRDVEQPELDAADHRAGEPLTIWRRRYREARQAGLDQFDSTVFADSDADVGVLRKLAAAGCDPQTIAEIVL